MDQVSAGEARHDIVRARRRRMRDEARSAIAAPVTDRYQTPEWLERSFVLPLTQPEAIVVSTDERAGDVPNQSVPHHDDDVTGPETDPVAPLSARTGFVRPASVEIDFATVIRRSDLCRQVTWMFWAATGLALVALVAYLLVGAMLLLATVVVCALLALGAFGTRLRISRAPVPRLQR